MRDPIAMPTLAATLLPAGRTKVLQSLLLAMAGTMLLTLSAKIQVPFWPVPMTMQTAVVVIIGMAYGWRLGGATVALYLAQGAMGLPVFAGTPEKGIGLAYMMGPTGGYLAGFLAAAVVVGWLAEHGWDRSFVRALAASLLGTAVIFGLGVPWLAVLIGPAKAIAFGLTPFLAGAALKIALSAAVMSLAWRWTRAWRG